jgi:hypothetical protein
MIDLESLSNGELRDLSNKVQAEQDRRLEETVGELKPGMEVVTLQPGFGGGAGVTAYYLGFVKEGEDPEGTGAPYGGNYHRFSPSPSGPCRWLLETHRVGKMIKIVS